MEERLDKVDRHLLSFVFSLGELLETLSGVSAGMKVRGHGGVIETLDGLEVSWQYVQASLGDDTTFVQIECKRWKKLLRRKYRVRNHINQLDAYKIRQEFSGYRRECHDRLLHTVIPTARLGALSNEVLECGPSGFFQRKVWKSLPKSIKEDLYSAVVCLLVGEWTPAVMISLRASEEAVRQYYRFKTKKPVQEKGKFRSWKNLIDELLSRDDVKKSLIGHLDFIREKRNEAEHPGKVFTNHEAERTFHQVVGTLIEIYTEMKPSGLTV